MGAEKKYIRLYNTIVEAIKEHYSAGSKLPTEQELSEKYGVSRQTVRKTLELLKENGYVSSTQGSGSYVNASPLTKKGPKQIAVILTYIGDFLIPSILRGIESIASENQYSIMVHSTNNNFEKEREILKAIAESNVDGVIVEGTKCAIPNPNFHFYKALLDKGVPVVFMNGYYPDLVVFDNACSVTTHDRKTAYILTETLLRSGHREIGGIFINDEIQGVERFSGYADAFNESGRSVKDEYLIWTSIDRKRSLEEQFAGSKITRECSAVLCGNDELAFQISSFIEKHHTNIKAVFSFDGIMKDEIKDGVAYHSCKYPKDAIGIMAVKKLINLINCKHEGNLILEWDQVEPDGEMYEAIRI